MRIKSSMTMEAERRSVDEKDEKRPVVINLQTVSTVCKS